MNDELMQEFAGEFLRGVGGKIVEVFGHGLSFRWFLRLPWAELVRIRTSVPSGLRTLVSSALMFVFILSSLHEGVCVSPLRRRRAVSCLMIGELIQNGDCRHGWAFGYLLESRPAPTHSFLARTRVILRPHRYQAEHLFFFGIHWPHLCHDPIRYCSAVFHCSLLDRLRVCGNQASDIGPELHPCTVSNPSRTLCNARRSFQPE